MQLSCMVSSQKMFTDIIKEKDLTLMAQKEETVRRGEDADAG